MAAAAAGTVMTPAGTALVGVVALNWTWEVGEEALSCEMRAWNWVEGMTVGPVTVTAWMGVGVDKGEGELIDQVVELKTVCVCVCVCVCD